MAIEKIDIYCDGGCKDTNGGYGYIIVVNDMIFEKGSGYKSKTTNNRMELTAFIKAMERVNEVFYKYVKELTINVYSDSQYLINTYLRGWARNRNIDLWGKIDLLIQQWTINWNWVKGHSNCNYNNECDRLATTAYENKSPYKTTQPNTPLKEEIKPIFKYLRVIEVEPDIFINIAKNIVTGEYICVKMDL